MDVKKTLVFNEQEKQSLNNVVIILNDICYHFEYNCSQCPFTKMCDGGNIESTLAKLAKEGQVIVE